MRHVPLFALVWLLCAFAAAEETLAQRILPTDRAVNASLTVGSPVLRFRFDLPEAHRVRLATRGSTALRLTLRTAGGSLIDPSKHNGSSGSDDLVNRLLECDLPSGAYRVEVRHRVAGGVGDFRLRLHRLKRLDGPADPGSDPGAGPMDDPPAKRESLAELRVQAGHIAPLRCSALAGDATLLALTGASDASYLWHVPTGRELATFPASRKCAIADDGRVVLIAGDESIRVYHGPTRRLLASQALKNQRPRHALLRAGLDGRTLHIAVTTSPPDQEACNQLYVATVDSQANGMAADFLGLGVTPATAADVTEDGAVWLGGEDGVLRRLKPRSSEVAETIPLGASPIEALIAAGDNVLAAERATHQLTLIRDGQPPRILARLDDSGQPRKSRLLDGSDFFKERTFVEGVTPNLELRQFVVSTDRRHLFVADSDGYVIRWSLASGAPQKVFEADVIDAFPPLTCSQDGHRFLIGSGLYEAEADKPAVPEVDAGGQPKFDLKRGPTTQLAVLEASWQPPKNASLEPMIEFVGNAATRIEKLIFDTRRRRVSTILDDRTLRHWSLDSGEHSIDRQVTAASAHLVLLDQGRYLVADGAVVRQFQDSQLETSYEIGKLAAPNTQAPPPDVRFLIESADGKIAAATRNEIHLIDIEAKTSKRLHQHSSDWVDLQFHGQGRWIVGGDSAGRLHVLPTSDPENLVSTNVNGRVLRVLILNALDETIASVQEVELAALLEDGSLWIRRGGMESRTTPLFAGTSSKLRSLGGGAVCQVDRNRVLVGDDRGNAALVDLDSPDEPVRFPVSTWAITDVAARRFQGRRLAIFVTTNKQCSLWDLERSPPAELCRMVGLRDNGYFVYDIDNRFDTDLLEEAPGVHWVFRDAPFAPGSPSLFQREFYEPNLLGRKVADDSFAPVPSIIELDRVQPIAKIESVTRAASGLVDAVDIQIAIRPGKVDQATGEVRGRPYDLRLFRDGQLIRQYPAPGQPVQLSRQADAAVAKLWQAQSDVIEKIAADNSKEGRPDSRYPGGYLKVFRDIPLPHRKANQDIEFTTYAFNQDRVRGEIDRVRFKVDAMLEPRTPRAYVLAVGVNAYESTDWDLNYAANDASRFLDVMRTSLDGYEVIALPLLADYHPPVERKRIRQSFATKENVKQIFEALADGQPPTGFWPGDTHRLRRITPDDLLIVFLAGHGFTKQSGEFYFFPHDIGPNQPPEANDEVLRRAISSEELWLWMHTLDAGRCIMIIDACQAGGIAPAGLKFGPFGSRGLGQLAYDKGMQVLAASQLDEVAIEIAAAEHGLMTYALVIEAIFNKRAMPGGANGFTLDDCLNFAVENISLIYRELLERPTTDADRRVVTRGRTAASKRFADMTEEERGIFVRQTLQRPSLFNFYRGDMEIRLK